MLLGFLREELTGVHRSRGNVVDADAAGLEFFADASVDLLVFVLVIGLVDGWVGLGWL